MHDYSQNNYCLLPVTVNYDTSVESCPEFPYHRTTVGSYVYTVLTSDHVTITYIDYRENEKTKLPYLSPQICELNYGTVINYRYKIMQNAPLPCSTDGR
jgi:hypothetical protein